jgi:hypothetical protein
MILDSFRREAKFLLEPRMWGWSIWLRLEGDSDDPSTWHPVKTLNDSAFREDLTLPFVKAITVEFHDETPDTILNEDDEVEFAVPRPAGRDDEQLPR